MSEDNAPILDLNAVEPVLDLSEFEPVSRGTEREAPTEKSAALPVETREQELARKNRHWNTSPIPQKWIHFYDLSDLAAFGIADPINDPRRLFVDIMDESGDGSPFGKANPILPNRMCNPLYVDAYRAWKDKRFPHGLPDRYSTWRIRWESRVFVNSCANLLRTWPPEFSVGEDLRAREHQRGEVAGWEEPFCRELYFEILLGHRREFVVMFETDDTGGAYFASREPVTPSKPTPKGEFS
jgi:hypothetical protein